MYFPPSPKKVSINRKKKCSKSRSKMMKQHSRVNLFHSYIDTTIINYVSIVSNLFLQKGFLIVVQDKLEGEGGTTIGKFIPGNMQKTLKCSEKNTGITHTNSELKNEVTVNWEIPEDLASGDELVIRASVVYKYNSAERLRLIYNLE